MSAPTPTPSEPAASAGARSQAWLCRLLLVAAVGLVYWNSLSSPFLFDDQGAVVNNPTIRQLGTALRPPVDGSTTTGRPIVNLSFAINHALSGDDVRSYHGLNVLIHAAAALALLGLVRLTLGRPALDARLQSIAEPMAFAVAALWALHPLQTESVTCIAQRTESLCGLFYLLTLYCFARAASSPRAAGWSMLSVFACGLGMGTKEVMVTAPLLVLLYDRTFVARSFAAAGRQRRGYYAALASTWLLLAWLALAQGGSRGTAAGFGFGISPWTYLLKQCEALVLYLKLSLWPHPLVLDYGVAVPQSWTEVWWQGAVVLALLAGTAWALVRRPVLGFVGAWFFLILAPSSSVVPLVTQTMAEHRMYLPLAGLVCWLAAGLHRWLGTRAWPVLAALAVVLGGLTTARNSDYRDALSIWTDTVAKQPGSARAQVNLGVELSQAGRPEEALPHFARAIELPSEYAVSGHYHYGAASLAVGRLAEAIEHLETAVRLAPEHGDAQFTLGNALVAAGRPAEALVHFEAALRLKPGADAESNLGVALARLGREEEAIRHFTAALQLEPDLAVAHGQLARLLSRNDQTAAAAGHFAEAVRLAPDQPETRNDFGLFLARQGRLEEAMVQLREAVRLKPGYAEARGNLGNTLLFQGRAREAIGQFEEALRLKPDDAGLRANLQLAREALRTP